MIALAHEKSLFGHKVGFIYLPTSDVLILLDLEPNTKNSAAKLIQPNYLTRVPITGFCGPTTYFYPL